MLILNSFVDTPASELSKIMVETLIVNGAEDHDNGSGAALAQALGHGRFVEIPGNHMNAVMKPELGRAIRDFLLA